MDKSEKRLWAIAICVWVAVICLLLLLYLEVAYPVNQPKSVSEADARASVELASSRVIEKEVEAQPTMYELAIKATKAHYADEIARCAFLKSQEYNLPVYFIYAAAGTESSGHKALPVSEVYINKNAYNKYYKATGCFQITPICLKEYNDWHSVKYTLDDMYNIEKNFEVGCWYLARIRDWYLRNQNHVTFADMYLCYNVGPNAYKKYREEYYSGWDPIRNCDYDALCRFYAFMSKYYNYFSKGTF